MPLIRYFIYPSTHHLDTNDPAIRANIGKAAGLTGIICNSLLAIIKLLIGILSASMSITVDGLNNLSDAASSIVTMIGFKLAQKPADTKHPYGHARYEYISGLIVSLIIIIIGLELAKSSIDKILNPSAIEFSSFIGGALLFSILVKLWLYHLNQRLGIKLQSTTLKATAADSRNDVITTSAVLVAVLIEHFTSWYIDGYMGLAVSLFILWNGINLTKETISPLLGEQINQDLRQQIIQHITNCPKVLGWHNLMVHDYGPQQRFASIHVEMDRNNDPLIAHELIDQMEKKCQKDLGIYLVIHYDPIITDDPELNKIKYLVEHILKMRDTRITIHDFRIVPDGKRINISFEIILPTTLIGQELDIQTSLENTLNCLDEKTYSTVMICSDQHFN